MTKIGLIGCGMWGRNLARNLAQLEVLAAVADQNTASAEDFASTFATKALAVDALINDETIDGIVIATAAPSHDALAIDGLAAGKHIYVEKPLSLTLAGAKSIQDAAIAAKKQVMVGHLIRYHAAFIELQKQVAGGAIGSLRHVQANRLAMGRIRNTESVLFDLCPHDLSLILALVGNVPTKIHCAGASHMTAGVVDFLSSFLGFENGVSAGMQTSWLSPFKEHRLTVTGSAGSLVFDDTKPWPEKLTLYQDQMRLNGEHFLIDRASPIALPIAEAEPLKDEMRAF
ncbi:MAG: gfo/Idh/MocA family oxidoreductase, partial [Alphaproteobacteria bacterium]|nr:gfo/Idh/MocA family oxidoreductase [Alphaproteobacteria bacterium]